MFLDGSTELRQCTGDCCISHNKHRLQPL